MAIAFDTLKFAETLEEAGIDRKQASAIAAAVRDSHEAADLATKGDIEPIRRDMELLRRDLTLKMGGMLAVGFGTVIGFLVKIMA